MKIASHTLWRPLLFITLVVTAGTLLSIASCSQKQDASDLAILKEQARMMILAEADQGFQELFKSSFDHSKAQMLIGADLQTWCAAHPKALLRAPGPTRESINNGQGMALLIQGGLPGKGGTRRDVVYLRPSRSGINRFFVFGDATCPDGNPVTCDFCTGCSGEAEPGGTIHTCVCTESCTDCHPCPTC